MSVLQSDLRLYGSANMQDTSGSTQGGAVTFSTSVFFSDLTTAVTPGIVSEGTDAVATLTVTSLTGSGVLQTDGPTTLVSTTVTAMSLSATRLMKATVGGTPANTVAVLGNKAISNHTMQAGTSSGATLQSGDGASVSVGMIIRVLNNTPVGVQFQLRQIIAVSGDVVVVNLPWGTNPSSATTYDVWTGMLFPKTPNAITTVRRIFYGAYAQASGGSTNTWYEKIFAVNDNTTTALTSAAILKQADPSGLYSGSGALDFALCNSLNDTSTISTNLNPGTAPSSITSYSSGAAPQTVNVPSPQNLPSGAASNSAGAQGMWLKLTLVAGEATVNSFADFRITGQTIMSFSAIDDAGFQRFEMVDVMGNVGDRFKRNFQIL